MIPAENLLNKELGNNWQVIKKIEKDIHSTGGQFSRQYIVQSKEGKIGFLKAIDYSEALQSEDSASALNALTESFLFEKEVLQKCRHEGLDKVVVAIDDGQYRFENGDVVPYLIFELADGDVRKQIILNSTFDLAWNLRSLHHIAIGLQQLHKHQIAHQDLKPSNILVFSKRTSKIADFGRSAYKGHNPPHEKLLLPGDYSYAPPEQLYGFESPDWVLRKFGCDLFQLGSMITFFFCGIQMTTLFCDEIPPDKWYTNWGGTFEEVLPYLNNTFYLILEKLKDYFPEDYKNELVNIVAQLCEPDPRKRGNVGINNASPQFSMDVYVSKFDRLAGSAEVKLRAKI